MFVGQTTQTENGLHQEIPCNPLNNSARCSSSEKATTTQQEKEQQSPSLKPLLDTASPSSKEPSLGTLSSLFEQGKISSENLVPLVLLEICKSYAKRLQTQKKIATVEQEWLTKQQERQYDLALQEIEQAKKVATSSKVQNITSCAALTLASVAALCTSITPFGLLGAGLGGLITLDAIFDNTAKHTLASFLSQKNAESKEAWLTRLDLFMNISSFALSFGLQGPLAIKVGTKLAQSVTGAYYAKETLSLNELKADLMQSEELSLDSERKQEEIHARLAEMAKFAYHLYEMLKAMNDQQNRVMQFMYRV